MVRIELQLCVRPCVERERGVGLSEKPAVRLCWAKHTLGLGASEEGVTLLCSVGPTAVPGTSGL